MHTTLSSGTYIIADPSWIIRTEDDEHQWEHIVHDLHSHNGDTDPYLGKYRLGGVNLVATLCPEGDGVYGDNRDNHYAVDSGVIAVYPFRFGGIVVYPGEELEVETTQRGLRVGDLHVTLME